MSRIDEALRRAAKEGPGPDVPITAAVFPLEGQEVTSLAREPFPGETSGNVRRLGVEGEATAPTPTESAAAEAPEHEANAPDGRAKTLFERIDARLAEKVVADANMSPVSREQYRRLAGVLHDAQGTSGMRVVMITSAVPSEGKTLTASNVALTLSDSYRRRVLLIDADLRKPALHEVFRLNTVSGLIDGLEALGDTKLVLRQVSANLAVLPAGRPTSDPMAALTSERMRRLVEEAKETFDWVIIDTPPLMLLNDAHLLSSMIDAAVLVVKANSTPHEMVKRTADTIGRDRVIGVVLNHAEAHAQPGYGGYAYYYLPAQEDGTQA